ncbi:MULTISPECIES: AIPR family protein [Paenibacillus]|uniref:AIPR family protein n=1 Tax=Paenibacillus TaxID=44249 RepID=UPI002DB55E78|nr:AIPR family protein [Paenibacillus odorifer]MEC0134348.1 AIPR family protein [Paenibacillus odorifer]MEC0222926.1 AIPR family protein [Paenibacillus odorifer]
MEKDLREYSEDFKNYVDGLAKEHDKEQLNVFTEVVLDYMRESGEIGEFEVFNFRRNGIQLNGYSWAEEDEEYTLTLVVSLHTRIVPPLVLRKNDWEPVLKRALSFYRKSLGGLYKALTKENDVFETTKFIYEHSQQIQSIRVVLLTDGIAKNVKLDKELTEGITAGLHVWDIERLFRLLSSGKSREPVEIDLSEKLGGEGLPCLKMPLANDIHEAYLLFMPGQLLANIYEEYGERLIERNVRSFLQMRGTNRGIRDTIINEPDMFVAYNNGISATSDKVEFMNDGNGNLSLSKIHDFQIVNGGQTTASIYHTHKKKIDISRINVPMKLTVIKDTEKMDEVVPRISAYANSQNKVQTDDFFSNDPYHRKIEQYSRTIWAPPTDNNQKQSKWFYERARGQYLDLKGREKTRSGRNEFDQNYPKSRLFTKTDLAKYINSWDQLPHIVSRGSQKNFMEFTKRVSGIDVSKIEQDYFKDLISKAILFNGVSKRVNYKYRSNIVTYTISWLSHKTQQQIDLEMIWRKQELPDSLKEVVDRVADAAYRHIINPPGGENITEWCKKEECWNQFRDMDVEIMLGI